MPLTDEAIDAIASAIFEKPGAQVLEAYSAFDQDPAIFTDVASLAAYVKSRLLPQGGLADLFVIYPDMGGRAVKRTIYLDPAKVDGHRIRYTWEGWGLISIQLRRASTPSARSTIGSNSETRAKTWAATYPEWDAPSTWNWRSVTSHTRRLKRALRSVAPD